MFNSVEIFGLFGSLLILLSMCFNANSFKGNLRLRIFNGVGSFVYVIYGILISSPSNILLNAILVVINAYHLLKVLKMREEGIKGLVNRQKVQKKHWKEYELKKKKQSKNKKNK